MRHMRVLPVALLGVVSLAGLARAEHAGNYTGMGTATSGGQCHNGMVNVTITATELTMTPSNFHFTLTWNADSFVGTSPQGGRVSGSLNGDRLTYDFVGPRCTYHLDLKRTQ